MEVVIICNKHSERIKIKAIRKYNSTIKVLAGCNKCENLVTVELKDCNNLRTKGVRVL